MDILRCKLKTSTWNMHWSKVLKLHSTVISQVCLSSKDQFCVDYVLSFQKNKINLLTWFLLLPHVFVCLIWFKRQSGEGYWEIVYTWVAWASIYLSGSVFWPQSLLFLTVLQHLVWVFGFFFDFVNLGSKCMFFNSYLFLSLGQFATKQGSIWDKCCHLLPLPKWESGFRETKLSGAFVWPSTTCNVKHFTLIMGFFETFYQVTQKA